MANKEDSLKESLSVYIDHPNGKKVKKRRKPKRFTVVTSLEAEEAVDFLSRETKDKKSEVLEQIIDFFSTHKQQHVDLYFQVAVQENNLFFQEDYAPYLENFPEEDNIAQKFIPTALLIGFSGSKRFGLELMKVKKKQLETHRKTYWMDEDSIDDLDALKDLFGMNRSQTLEFLIKFYFRILGYKEEVEKNEEIKLAGVIEEMMEELSDHFEQLRTKFSTLKENHPKHFESIDWSTSRMDFDDEGIGWDGAIDNFLVLQNNFEKYVHSNSKGLLKDFLDMQEDDGGDAERGNR